MCCNNHTLIICLAFPSSPPAAPCSTGWESSSAALGGVGIVGFPPLWAAPEPLGHYLWLVPLSNGSSARLPRTLWCASGFLFNSSPWAGTGAPWNIKALTIIWNWSQQPPSVDLKVKMFKHKCAIVYLSHWDTSASLPLFRFAPDRKNCPLEYFTLWLMSSEPEFLSAVINWIALLSPSSEFLLFNGVILVVVHSTYILW